MEVAVIYSSRYGHTKVVAEKVLAGIQSVAGVKGSIFTAEEAIKQLDKLDAMDGMVFGSPTYMGSVASEFKAFMEASSGKWGKQMWKNKIAGGFSNSAGLSGDKLCTLEQLAVFGMQHGMIWVGCDLLPGQDNMNRIGSWLGVMTQSDNDKGPDMAPPESDLRTAEYFGKRIAEMTKRFNK
jgi:NAD(P)H dehydrogenase (quinone)